MSSPNHFMDSDVSVPSLCKPLMILSTSARSESVGNVDDLSKEAAKSSENTGEPSCFTGKPAAMLALTTVWEVTYPDSC